MTIFFASLISFWAGALFMRWLQRDQLRQRELEIERKERLMTWFDIVERGFTVIDAATKRATPMASLEGNKE